MPKVFIVASDSAYDKMFKLWNWTLVSNVQDADLVQFTGGEDVSPIYYDQDKHRTTRSNIERDEKEALIFKLATKLDKPMAGICRGGQFLNVMCGGSMYQDVDHHCGVHKAVDTRTGEEVRVTSTHHQMMIPGPGSQLILIADKSTVRENMGPPGSNKMYRSQGVQNDTEAVLYEKKKVFCFQPHPEYTYVPGLDALYMVYLNEFFGLTSSMILL